MNWKYINKYTIKIKLKLCVVLHKYEITMQVKLQAMGAIDLICSLAKTNVVGENINREKKEIPRLIEGSRFVCICYNKY